ncbi:DNA-directed RNA polymerase I subunit RPA34 isoform X2 [Tyto alba]|uniref:DNA-directed RNA polymerase I subunit RPA34 isoform X2 n=1 Tax=Tyto alba TaxID=56313 RepID=UPI001C66AE94|nr:DNA-directed RNA polymerase I subunit RPA34 isoform X2 [Tyto alba]
MEGPMRFRCPPEFEAVTPSPLPGLRGEALEGPSTELWLIRAPADFSPESDPPRAQAGEEEEEEDDDDDDEGATGDARGVNTRGGSTRRGGGK